MSYNNLIKPESQRENSKKTNQSTVNLISLRDVGPKGTFCFEAQSDEEEYVKPCFGGHNSQASDGNKSNNDSSENWSSDKSISKQASEHHNIFKKGMVNYSLYLTNFWLILDLGIAEANKQLTKHYKEDKENQDKTANFTLKRQSVDNKKYPVELKFDIYNRMVEMNNTSKHTSSKAFNEELSEPSTIESPQCDHSQYEERIHNLEMKNNELSVELKEHKRQIER